MGRRVLLFVLALVLAVAGTGIVLAYVSHADSRALAGEQTATVVVAKAKIPAGTSTEEALRKGWLGYDRFAQKAVPAGALIDTSSLNGKVALATIYDGQIVLPGLFGQPQQAASGLQIPDKMLALTISLDDPHHVGPFLLPGSQIAVFDTFTNANGASAPYLPSGAGLTNDAKADQVTRLLLPKLTVLATGASTAVAGKTSKDSTSTTSSSGNLLITVAVTQAEAQQLVLAAETGTLTCALLSDTSQVAPNGGTDVQHLFGG